MTEGTALDQGNALVPFSKDVPNIVTSIASAAAGAAAGALEKILPTIGLSSSMASVTSAVTAAAVSNSVSEIPKSRPLENAIFVIGIADAVVNAARNALPSGITRSDLDTVMKAVGADVTHAIESALPGFGTAVGGDLLLLIERPLLQQLCTLASSPDRAGSLTAVSAMNGLLLYGIVAELRKLNASPAHH